MKLSRHAHFHWHFPHRWSCTFLLLCLRWAELGAKLPPSGSQLRHVRPYLNPHVHSVARRIRLAPTWASMAQLEPESGQPGPKLGPGSANPSQFGRTRLSGYFKLSLFQAMFPTLSLSWAQLGPNFGGSGSGPRIGHVKPNLCLSLPELHHFGRKLCPSWCSCSAQSARVWPTWGQGLPVFFTTHPQLPYSSNSKSRDWRAKYIIWLQAVLVVKRLKYHCIMLSSHMWKPYGFPWNKV